MPRSQRTRSARAIANDTAIRDSAISEVLRVGVDHVSLRDVGHHAGLTHGATYARYEDVDELLVDLWNSVLAKRATALFEMSMTAAGVTERDERGSPVRLHSRHDPGGRGERASVVDGATHSHVERRGRAVCSELTSKCDPHASERDQALFARGLTLFAMTMMQIFANSQFGWDREYQAVLEKLLIATLEIDPSDVTPVTFSPARRPHHPRSRGRPQGATRLRDLWGRGQERLHPSDDLADRSPGQLLSRAPSTSSIPPRKTWSSPPFTT